MCPIHVAAAEDDDAFGAFVGDEDEDEDHDDGDDGDDDDGVYCDGKRHNARPVCQNEICAQMLCQVILGQHHRLCSSMMV